MSTNPQRNESSPGACKVGNQEAPPAPQAAACGSKLLSQASEPNMPAGASLAHEIPTPVAEEGNLSSTPSSRRPAKVNSSTGGHAQQLHTRGFPSDSKTETPGTKSM